MRKRLFSPLIFFTQLTALVLSPLSYADTLPETHTLTIHGSNTIGAKLAPALISGYLQSLGAKNIRQQESGENESQITATFAPDAGNNANKAVINIAAHGSGTGFKGLKSGTADIAAASRPAKQKEVDSLSQMTELNSLGSEHIVGIDGLDRKSVV